MSAFTSVQLLLLLKLVLAHLLSDYFFQAKSWVDSKNKSKVKSPELYYHIGITFLAAWVVTGLFWISIIISILHYLIDLAKIYSPWQNIYTFLLDQVLHLIVLLAIWVIYLDINGLFSQILNEFSTNYNFFVFLMGYVFISVPAGILIGMFTNKWRNEISNSPDRRESLSQAGQWIGILERMLVLTFILINQFSAIGFLIAAKAILRFRDSEIKQMEYVLIGTLSSFTLTILVGLLIKSLLI